MEHAAALDLTVSHTKVLIATAKAQDSDFVPVEVETAHGIHQRYHDGVVRPNTAIGKVPGAVSVGREERRCSGCRQCHRDQFFLPVEAEVRVVRGLEDVDLVEPIEGGNVQTHIDRAQCPVAKAVSKRSLQGFAVVSIDGKIAGELVSRSQRTTNSSWRRPGPGKYFRPMAHIDFQNLLGAHSCCHAERDYSSG